MTLKKYRLTVDLFAYRKVEIPQLQQLITDLIESEEDKLVDKIEIEEMEKE